MTLDEPITNRVQDLRVVIGPKVVRLNNPPVELLFAVLRGFFAAVAVKNSKIREQNIAIRVLAARLGLVAVRLRLALKPYLVAVLHVLAVALYRVRCHSHIHNYIFIDGWLLLRYCGRGQHFCFN